MRPSLGLLCSAGLWGAPMRATATGPLQGPGNTPLLVYASSVLCCPIPLFLGAPLPIFFSTLEVAQPPAS